MYKHLTLSSEAHRGNKLQNAIQFFNRFLTVCQNTKLPTLTHQRQKLQLTVLFFINSLCFKIEDGIPRINHICLASKYFLSFKNFKIPTQLTLSTYYVCLMKLEKKHKCKEVRKGHIISLAAPPLTIIAYFKTIYACRINA